MKKIVLVANTSWYLANFYQGLIKEFHSEGYEVHVIAPNDKDTEKLSELPCFYYEWRINQKGLNPLEELSSVFNLYKLINKIKPDLVNSFTIKPNIYVGFISKFLKFKFKPTVSGLGSMYLKAPIHRFVTNWLYKVSLSKTNCCFFLNKSDYDYFTSNRIIDVEKSKLVPGTGLDLEYFNPTDYPNNMKYQFLYIGRLLYDKGLRELADAVRLINEKKDFEEKIRIHYLGTLNYNSVSSIPLSEFEAWQAEGIFEYLGTTSDVRDFLSSTKWLILPSYREGLSRVVMESLAMGTPALVSNVPGCNDLINNSINGLLFEAKDPVSTASTINKALNVDDDIYDMMKVEARKFAEMKLSTSLVYKFYGFNDDI